MRIALVNDWLTHLRGQERVFEHLCKIYPTADVFTFVHDAEQLSTFSSRVAKTSFVQHLPGARRHFRIYWPLYPSAAKSIDLRDYDLVISSSSAWALGVSVATSTTLVCYCHSPFRYIWSHYDQLVGNRLGPLKGVALPFRSLLRTWDQRAAARVNHFIATSRLVQQRITAFYGRNSCVIPPPVNLTLFRPQGRDYEDYFLVVAPLMRWKCVSVAVEAFTRLGLPLKVVGEGEEDTRLRRLAGSNVEFLGGFAYHRTEELVQLYAGCKALVLTSIEDFGLTAVEAMACGRPVLALRGGGALDTVLEGTTGRFFDSQDPEYLADAVRETDWDAFDPMQVRKHAETFGFEAFKLRIVAEVNRSLAGRPPERVA